MQTTTVGVFNQKEEADTAITELRDLGVSDTDISYVYNSPQGTVVRRDNTGTNVADGTASGATAGVVLGAIAGLIVANGLLPGFGTLFVAGPIAAALGLTGAAAITASGAITGAVAGGLLGALMGLGMSSSEATMYEERVRRGGILVTARSFNPAAARRVFKKYGADEIREYKFA